MLHTVLLTVITIVPTLWPPTATSDDKYKWTWIKSWTHPHYSHKRCKFRMQVKVKKRKIVIWVKWVIPVGNQIIVNYVFYRFKHLSHLHRLTPGRPVTSDGTGRLDAGDHLSVPSAIWGDGDTWGENNEAERIETHEVICTFNFECLL